MATRYVRYPALGNLASLSLVGSISGGVVTITANPSTATYNLVLPAAQGGAGTTLINDGSGNLSWGAGGGGSAITALTGDGTATGPGSVPFTLATVNSNVGSFGSATQVTGFTVNGKGLVTAASNISIQITESQVTNLVADLAGKQAVGNYITALTGDVTAAGPGSVAATIAANVVTNAKLAQMPANTIKGNNTGGTANALDLTTAQTTAMLDNFVGDTTSVAGTKGLVSAPPAGSTLIRRVLKADNTFSANFPLTTPTETTTAVSTWITRSATAANQWFNLAWAPEIRQFAAIASSGTNRVMTSSDGITWAAQSAAVNNTWTAIVWSPNLRLYAAVAFDGTTADNIMTSPDGVTWTSRTSPQANQWYSICWSPALNLFCATSLNGTNRVMTSPNGITWTAQTSPTAQWYDVCWADELNLFVAVALGGSIMTSPNGVTWTSQTGIGANDWYDVTYSAQLGLLVAVGITGANRVMTSPDGITWTGRNAASAAAWRRVEWSKDLGIFVATSSGGDIMSSVDGITWVTRTSPEANQWYGLAYAPDLKIFAVTGITGTNRVLNSTYIEGLNTSGNTGPTGATGATGPTGPTGPAAASAETITASAVQTAQQTTTSAAFVDIPGLSTTITTTIASKIVAHLDAIVQCTSVTANGEFRLVIDAQNSSTAAINLVNTTEQKDVSSNFLSTQIAAGTYTVKAQYRETSGLGTLALNTGRLFVQAQQTAGPYTMSQAAEFREDWTAGTTAGNTNWTAAQTGTGAASSIVSTNLGANNNGVVQLSTGTTATGRSSLDKGTAAQFFGGGICTTEMLVYIPTLSTVAQEYTLRLGFGDLVTGADMVDGVYFEYDRLSSVNWRAKTANNSTRTTTDTGVAVAAGAWIKLSFVVNAAGTSVAFYINGTLAATNAANIPITNARVCAPTLIINKSAGTTALTLLVDYFTSLTVFTSPR